MKVVAHDILRAGAGTRVVCGGDGNEIGRYGAHGLKKRAWERASSDGATRAPCSKSARGCSDCLAALCSTCSLQIISTPASLLQCPKAHPPPSQISRKPTLKRERRPTPTRLAWPQRLQRVPSRTRATSPSEALVPAPPAEKGRTGARER